MDGLMMRRHALLARPLGSPLTVSGPTPLLMPGAMSKPMRAATFAISPVQSGSGDPSPSNVRPIMGWTAANCYVTGHNVWDEEWEVGTFNTTTGVNIAVSNQIRTKNKIPIIGGASYFFSAPPNYAWFIFFDAEGNVLTDAYISDNRSGNSSSIYSGSSFTAPNNARYMRFYLLTGYGDTYKNNIAINYPSTFMTYTPYSGSTVSVAFPALGKNLLKYPLNYVSNIAYIIFDNAIYLKNGEYTLSFASSNATSWRFIAKSFDADGNIRTSGTDISGLEWRSTGVYMNGRNTTYKYQNLTVNVDGYYAFGMAFGDMTSTTTFTDSQLEEGSAATAYEPYDNTIYVGTIDPVTGQGVVTHGCVTLDGTENWTGNNFFYTPLDAMAKLLDYRNEMFCDSLLVTQGNSTATFNSAAFTITGYRDTADHYKNQNWIYAKATDITTVAEMKQYLQEHPVQVVYPLATPIPFSITPQSLTPPAGDAYVWADCGGSAEVTYMGKA